MLRMDAQERQPVVAYTLMVIGVIAALGLWRQWSHQDVGFCQGVLRDLVWGRQKVERVIDWNHLHALGVNLGASYETLPDEKARASYRKMFVKGFAQGFERIKGRRADFQRWRVYKRDATQTVVAVDDIRHKKTLLFQIPASGQRRLEGIEWQADHVGS